MICQSLKAIQRRYMNNWNLHNRDYECHVNIDDDDSDDDDGSDKPDAVVSSKVIPSEDTQLANVKAKLMEDDCGSVVQLYWSHGLLVSTEWWYNNRWNVVTQTVEPALQWPQ